MTEKNNAVCSICGNPYYMCISCRDTIKLSPWKMHTDTAEHYKVFQIVKGLSTGVYTKDEAREKFKNVDLKDIESFRPHIKQIIKDVLKEEKIVVKNIKEVKTEMVEDVKDITKTTMSRKRVNKVEVEVE